MNSLVERLEKLSPAKRALLSKLILQQGKDFGVYPLSLAQQGFWFLNQLNRDTSAYSVLCTVQLIGTLHVDLLHRSVQQIVQRHQILRTVFLQIEGEPLQTILPALEIPLPLQDLRGVPASVRQETALRLATEMAQPPFDLTQGPLLRLGLCQLEAQEYRLMIAMHHIISDGWSLGVFLHELSTLYTAHVHGQPSPLADLPLQYVDSPLWQHEQMQGKLLDDQLAYWKERLAGTPLVLELPTDHPRPALQSHRGARFFFRFSPSLLESVADLSRREGATVFMTLLAAWQIVLGHTSQQEDFLVGVPVAGRQRREMEGLIGCFINTLVLRAELADHLTFRDLLKRVKESTLAAHEHQDMPFEQLVEALHPQRDLSRNPVFQVMVALQDMPFMPFRFSGLTASITRNPSATAPFDLYINMWEKADFDHWIEYPTDLFEEGTIARMVQHYQQVLEQVVVNADLPIARISLLTQQECQQVISDWNATQVDYSRPGWMHLWISEQAQRTPDAKALFFEQETMTYRQLEERSNQLGHYLQRLGVGPEQRVGIYLERSFSLVLALLSVLKAGGAYIPLDTSYPRERLEDMLKDAQVSLLLTQTSLRGRLSGFEGNTLVLDEMWQAISQESETVVSSQVSGQNLAYVIYTSGSTGRPKGVMNTHEGLANCLNWMQDTFGLSAADRVLQQTPTSFDVSVWEIFWPLMSGAGLVLARPGGQQDPHYIQDLIVSAEVTTVHFVPSMLQNYLQMQESYPIPKHNLQRIICIGEALSSATVARNQQQWAVPIFNLYGPTEATIQVTWWPCAQQGESQQTVPIGHPLANTQIYLLDKYGEPVPVGVAGELYIGGVQVARGYLHRPELTAERFVPDPWSSEPGGRLYKTGDLARYRKDGVIEFLGRLDQQVKLRGFRIELGEIEAILHTHPGVRDAVIATYEDNPMNKKLVAYVILEDSTGVNGQTQSAVPTKTQLQDWLRKKVPEYMIPPVFLYLDAFPLTANGKLDRRALPRPTSQSIQRQYTHVPPKTETEYQLTKIFADILSLEQIGIEENLFDLGFHSLLVTRTAARIRETLQVDVSPPLFFEHWSIKRLAQYLQKASSIKASSIVAHSLVHMEDAQGRGAASSIAIIGMSGTFPQAPDVQSLWNNLLEGRDCISEIPASRWDWQTYFGNPSPSNPNKTKVKRAGVIEGVETFDPQFFGISPREAELMDPQQRLLMMYVWKAIEDAGYSASSLSGTNTALFVGTATTGYSERSLQRGMEIDGYSATGLQPSMGPGRMSYFLDLHGPCEAIDTACSSSLIAIHRGVNAIESGQCSMAIVGGVNTLVSPEVHISISKAGILCEDGRCKTFSAQANGFVRGEGVGMLVLKKLGEAEQAGDHIYGVIIGSAENHGGRASSLRSPNPRAQADLLIAAYRKAGIDPRTISYIEAHGTGTVLGDPIEINGLKTAFSELITAPTGNDAWCGIGSVKSNIGHLEFAAGVAGVIKVLLQLHAKKLVKSLHCEPINPYIELKGSPFYIVQETQDWEALRDDEGNVLPRRAGISSFGFAGTNAHVVLEEYVPKSRAIPSESEASPEAVVVLSARNEERLHEQVRQLLAWISVGDGSLASPPSLRDLAYTLQAGREAMEERLAMVVGSFTELVEKLRRYLQEPQAGRDWYRGRVRQDKETVALMSDDELQEAISKWLQRGKYEKLLPWWVKGLTIDWNHLYTVGTRAAQGTTSGAEPRMTTAPVRPRRISLPTYPFARERCWIPVSPQWDESPHGTRHTDSIVALHPLVQRNISDFFAQRFSSTFYGDEFFLADHVIKGLRIMPAVAYLEMVRAAVAQAMGSTVQQKRQILRVNQMVWVRPLVIGKQPVEVEITLELQEKQQVVCSIRSRAHTMQDEVQALISQGRAELHVAEEGFQSLDLSAIQTRCSQQISAEQCYGHYRKQGINYGASLQGIEHLRVGEGEVLARLRLPVAPGLASGVAQTRTDFVLHPGILDAALQACVWSLMEVDKREKLALPFTLDEFLLVGEINASGWAWVCRRSSSQTGAELVCDIEVCDDEGRVAVQLHGLHLRPFQASMESASTMLLTPIWKEVRGEASALAEQVHPSAWLVLLCDLPDLDTSRLQAQLVAGGYCRSLRSVQGRREQRFHDTVVQLIQALQDLLQSQPTGQLLVQVVVAQREEPSLLQALIGVLQTAHRESPRLVGQLIEVEGEFEEEELLACLRENQLRPPQEPHIRYQDGKRWVREWQELDHSPVGVEGGVEWEGGLVSTPWKEGGCYLITGGAGGLARLFVQEIARHVHEATIILVGRSALTAPQRAQLEAAENSGILIDYQQVDVTNGPAIHTLIQSVLAKYGHLDGIIHAAGVLRDSLLLNKTPEDVQTVLASKVIGVEQLDEASREIPLAFFLLCSSLSAVTGNVGQADYAAANAYLDAFAHARQALVLKGERQGTTVSINWSLWQEGGMTIDAEQIQMMQAQTGIEVLDTETGMKTFYQALASGQAQVLVAHGQVERIKQRLLIRMGRAGDFTSIDPTRQESLREKANMYFKKQLAALIKLPMQQIDSQADLSDYGFDSILAIRFTSALEDAFGPLSKTLLFEYPTVQSVTEYFLHNYPTQLRSVLRIEETPATERVRTGASPVPTRFSTFSSSPIPIYDGHVQQDKMAKVNDIAIIGVAGRYPGARDLQAFWENLRQGRDCITEIPPERWDHRLYFDADKNKPGKTYSKWGGFLEGVDEFDPLFFNISPREAGLLDPQERLFLECVYATLEDAGYTREELSMYQSNGLPGNVGVFVGVMYEEYQLFGAQVQALGRPLVLSGSPSSIANRVSYFCNFRGPSMAVDTMCSSSLTAIHLACQSILHGGSGLAIAGGVNVSLHPNKYLGLSQGKFVSSQGHCESFGLGADGYVPAEGVGAVLLKPLAQAEADEDHIYGVIKATAINHGGKTNGYNVPNPQAQAEVIGQALKNARIDPRTISYIEAHGTGTVLGDPIEIAGLARAFQDVGGLASLPSSPASARQWCVIGSVKSNIGHAESAAGIAGVTKVLLQMRYGQLVPSLHSEVLNPHIDFSTTPFVVQQELSEWQRPQMPGTGEGKQAPRRAGISSFGAGGSNAHVILEEYVDREQTGDGRKVHSSSLVLIVLSARTQEQLKQQVQQLLLWIQREETGLRSIGLDNLAYTLQVGREAMEERLALQVSSLTELEEKLRKYLQDPQAAEDWYRGQVKPHREVVELFSTDKDLQEITNKWLQQREYEKIMQWWVKGLKISWHLLYAVGAGQAQDAASAQGTIPTAPARRPHRISLPTYPFARERYWFPIGENQRTIPTATDRTNENGKVVNKPNRIVLQPLTESALPSDLWDKPIRENQSQPPAILSPLDQSFPQSGTNGAVAIETSPLPEADPVATFSVLEEELARGLAKTLYMEESDIDLDKPFIEMGLDSVLSLEWIDSLNKQYAINLKAISVYDYPTIRQMADLLHKDLLKHGGEMQQVTVQPAPIFSLDDILEKVKKGVLSIDGAENVLSDMGLSYQE